MTLRPYISVFLNSEFVFFNVDSFEKRVTLFKLCCNKIINRLIYINSLPNAISILRMGA
jgi:hypothetical protein